MKIKFKILITTAEIWTIYFFVAFNWHLEIKNKLSSLEDRNRAGKIYLFNLFIILVNVYFLAKRVELQDAARDPIQLAQSSRSIFRGVKIFLKPKQKFLKICSEIVLNGP